jgi:streptogramin lyase
MLRSRVGPGVVAIGEGRAVFEMIGRGLKVAIPLLLASSVAMVAPSLAQAASVTEFTSGVSDPGAMVGGSDGNVWFINGAGIAKVDPSGQVTPYSAGLDSGATPYDLTNGPDGDLWFTDNGAKAVGYITPSGAIHEFPAPAGDVPLQIVAGSDGNVWFYSSGASQSIVRMTPGGVFNGYPMPTLGEIADNMVVGPDGDIWFSDMGTTSIGKIDPGGTITEYPLTTIGAIPTNITVGPDGDLWFSDNSGAIGRITTNGSVQEFSSGLQSGADPDAIAPGPDGNIWFTDQDGTQRAIGRVTPAGQITEFTTGLNDDLPLDITAGADGNLWVPQASMDPMTPSAVAEITPSGQITEITNGVNPTGLMDGDSILAGPNGALWFSDTASPKAIGRIVIPPVATTGPTAAVSSTGGTVTGSVTPRADTTSVSIQYGTSPSLGLSTAVGALTAGTTKESVTRILTALPSNATIYYRVTATNSGGESDGTVGSFRTSSPPVQKPPVQKTLATFGNQQITLTTPASSTCTRRTSKLAVTLNSAAIKNSKKAKLKFSKAVLYVDKGVKHTSTKRVRKHGKRVKVTVTTYKPNTTVNKLPASPNLKLSRLKSGQHTLKVTLSYIEIVRKHGHKTKKTVNKTLTLKFRVC